MPASTPSEVSPALSPSALITQRINELGGWRGAMLSQARRLTLEVDDAVIEEWKWMGTPVWSCSGIICTGESYKDKVKLTFAKGAFLQDPTPLFNASLEGNLRRAIDLHEGDALDEAAFKALVGRAIALNRAGKGKGKTTKR